MPARADVVEICRDLVRIPSVGPEHGEAAVVEYLAALLSTLPGAQHEILEGAPGRANLVCTLDSGVPGPTLIVNGHVDTVPVEPAGWTHDAYSGDVANGQLWGRGSCDMKGGVAALAAATIELAERGGPRAGKLVFTATADEDADGYWGLPWLLREGLLDGDAAIVAEPAGVDADFEQVYVATRGSVRARIEVWTPWGGHSSAYTGDPPHAVAVACAIQQELERAFRPTPASHPAYAAGPTVVAGDTFVGGEATGFLPERAALTIACRVLPGAQREEFLEQLRSFVCEAAGGAEVSVQLGGLPDPWGPPMDLDPAHPLAAVALRAVHRAGYRHAGFAGWPAFSEAGHLAARGIPTLPSLGPGRLGLAHLPDEHISVAALRAAVSIYGDIFDELLVKDSALGPYA